MYRINKIIKFSAGHYLPRMEESPCRFQHGHNYKVEIAIDQIHLDVNGMVCDFNTGFEDIEKMIERKLDHSYLNPIIKTPTAENIAKYIYDFAKTIHPCLKYVRVWETDDCYAEYRLEP